MQTKTKLWQALPLLFLSCTLIGQIHEPVTPNASPEARALLELLYNISDQYTLTGQHNFPISRDRNSQFAADYIGKTPIVWSQDLGFAKDGDKDSYLARPAIVEEAIRQHRLGAIITLCWHAVPPTADEPVTFQPLPGAAPDALASVQGKLLDQQFRDILTPGTALHKKWMAQVDEIAGFLRQLQDAQVPVLWRPYHEMNGDWFWWGGRYEGEYTTARLYRQIFDRLVKHHKLNNLIWMWSVDRPTQPGREFKNFYPGEEYLDVVSLDVYGSDFKQNYYDDLKALAKGKPLALGEVGVPPGLDILENQPGWTLYVIWSGMTRLTPKAQYKSYLQSPRMLFLEDNAYADLLEPLRNIAGLPAINPKLPADFSGLWVLNEQESEIQNSFGGGAAYKMNIIQIEEDLAVMSYTQSEWDDDAVSKELITGNGSDMIRMVFNSPQTRNAGWSPKKDQLIIRSKVTFHFGNNPTEVTGEDTWRLERKGRHLIIDRSVHSPRGKSVSHLVYERQ
ncbi:MAG: glycosyl hydrolase [Saprospiraceae bacterium]|nr:hypothetical protein [Lewinella sp.]